MASLAEPPQAAGRAALQLRLPDARPPPSLGAAVSCKRCMTIKISCPSGSSVPGSSARPESPRPPGRRRNPACRRVEVLEAGHRCECVALLRASYAANGKHKFLTSSSRTSSLKRWPDLPGSIATAFWTRPASSSRARAPGVPPSRFSRASWGRLPARSIIAFPRVTFSWPLCGSKRSSGSSKPSWKPPRNRPRPLPPPGSPSSGFASTRKKLAS